MSENPINCKSEKFTFLAETETMPFGLQLTKSIPKETEVVYGKSIADMAKSCNVKFDLPDEDFYDKTRTLNEMGSRDEQNENVQSVEERCLKLHI